MRIVFRARGLGGDGMTQRHGVTFWMVAASLLAASLLVTFFAVETARARRARLLAEGRRVALSAVTLYDVLRLTGSTEDRATLVSFVQAAVRGTKTADVPAGDVLVGLSTEPGARELVASVGLGSGAALLGAVGLALVLSTFVRRRVINPVEDELEAGREEHQRLAGVLARHVGGQRAPAIAAGERARTCRVTVLVVNVAGFLPMLQRQPPSATLHLLDELYATTTRVVHAHGGHVEKMLGDTVQCVWGISVAHTDDERRAVTAGLELQGEIAALASARKERGDEPLTVAIGIATGEAVVGTVGGATRAETVVVGEVTALANALEHEAQAHGFGLLVSEETFAGVATEYEGAASPPTLVHGIGVPLTFYRVRPRRAANPVGTEITERVRRPSKQSGA